MFNEFEDLLDELSFFSFFKKKQILGMLYNGIPLFIKHNSFILIRYFNNFEVLESA